MKHPFSFLQPSVGKSSSGEVVSPMKLGPKRVNFFLHSMGCNISPFHIDVGMDDAHLLLITTVKIEVLIPLR